MAPDIAIVGGGILGVCTAYYLLEAGVPGARIALIEADDIASKASGKAGGFIARDWHAAPTASLGRLSFALHQQLAAELEGERAYGYRSPVSNVCISVRPADGKATTRRFLTRGGQGRGPRTRGTSTYLPLGGARAHLPRPPAATGPAPASTWLNTEHVRDKELIGEAAGSVQVHPRAFCQTLWKVCEGRGVRLVRRRVEGMDGVEEGPGGRRCLKVLVGYGSAKEEGQDDALRIPFDKLVVVAGPWSGKLLKRLASYDAGITNLPGHSVVIEPSHALPAEAVFADIRGVSASELTTGAELFTRPDSSEGVSTVYVAGENTTSKPLPEDLHDASVDQAALERLLKACALISPVLAQGRVVSKALCYRPTTTRGHPIISGVPGQAGVFLCCGHGPWGISLGPGSGKVMAELVLGRPPSANISSLAL